MSKYLIRVEEIYRADSEAEGAQLIEEAKHDPHFDLTKYSAVRKEKTQKGEVIDSWVKVSLQKTFDDEVMPGGTVKVKYED